MFRCKANPGRIEAIEAALAEVLETVREIRQEQRILAEAKAVERDLDLEYQPPLRPQKRNPRGDRP